MITFLEFADAGAKLVAVTFIIGMIAAPLIVLAYSANWWKQRMKWAAVCAVTSWMGLWFFLRRQQGQRGPDERGRT